MAELVASTHLTSTTCCYCGVGCGMLIETESVNRHIQIKQVSGDPAHPANFGRLCSKGATLGLTAQPHIYAQSRAQFPELRALKTATRQRVSWEQACQTVADRFADIIVEHGPDAVALYVSGQLLTEDYYVFNKLAKGLIGTNNIDTNSRLCMSSAVAGYKQSLGADAPPCNYEDLDHASTIFITGSNTAYAHPILFRRIEAARQKNPNLKLIVVDPRKTDTASMADLFLQILPGTDVALYHGMLHIMLWEGWTDQRFIEAHTEGFAELKNLLKDYTPKAVAEICGIAQADLILAARHFAQSPATLSLYCQGLNQSAAGTDKNTALINLHLACAQIGKPGAGPFSLTGQPNAMGGREVGGLANLLSAHRDMKNPEHRQEVARLWGIPNVPATPGLTAVPMFEALRSGKLKAIWIVCTNPAQSLPDQTLVHEALARAEFVVVQEAYAHTATAAYADVLLPATTWAEKEGTVTNSERRISRVRAALPAFGESRNDWEIALDIARRLENRMHSGQSGIWHSLFNFSDAQSIWEEHRESTRGRDLDITGLSYAHLEREGPQQWPYPTGAVTGQARLYTDYHFQTPSGRARFIAQPHRATAEHTDARYPIGLTTGRLRDQWHGMSRTGTLARLNAHAPQACVDLSVLDARRLDLLEGELVYVTSRRGVQILPVRLTDSVRPSQAFIAMHWGGEHVSGHAGKAIARGVNSLTIAAIDPVSEQPELKFAAVKITKANLPWHLHAFAWVPADQAVRLQIELRSIFEHASFATAMIFGREENCSKNGTMETGLSLRMAHTEPFDSALLARIETLFNAYTTGENSSLSFRDTRHNTLRHLSVNHTDTEKYLTSVLLTGSAKDVEAGIWLRNYLETQADVSALGRRLLIPGIKPPVPMAARSRVICNCFNITQDAIAAHLAAHPALDKDLALQSLQASLSCGTNCGSCLPEIKAMIGSDVH
jgi:assimilatory nitrate reductase catalytic subunit